jgi:hypothetical protein
MQQLFEQLPELSIGLLRQRVSRLETCMCKAAARLVGKVFLEPPPCPKGGDFSSYTLCIGEQQHGFLRSAVLGEDNLLALKGD